MPKLTTTACLLILTLLASGCASRSRQEAVATCPPPPALPQPAAWMMELTQPTFSQRVQQLLPVSPETPMPAQ